MSAKLRCILSKLLSNQKLEFGDRPKVRNHQLELIHNYITLNDEYTHRPHYSHYTQSIIHRFSYPIGVGIFCTILIYV